MPELRLKIGQKDEHTRIRENVRRIVEEHNRQCEQQSKNAAQNAEAARPGDTGMSIEVRLDGEKERLEEAEITRRLKDEVRRRRALGETITPEVRKQIVDDVLRQYKVDKEEA